MKYKSNYIFIQYLHNIFPLPVLFFIVNFIEFVEWKP